MTEIQNISRQLFAIRSLALVIICIAPAARAEEGWSNWQTFHADGVSVSFTKVNQTTWTWKFRNDGYSTIKFMRFEYTDREGSHTDMLPFDLKPNAIFGGWTAFTASSNPAIRIVEIRRK